MDEVLDAARWVLYGLSLLALAAGIGLAGVYRKTQPSVARLAAVGLTCVLAASVVSTVTSWAYSVFRPKPLEVSLGLVEAVGLAEQLTHYILNFGGAVGWTLLLAALFSARRQVPATEAKAMEGAH